MSDVYEPVKPIKKGLTVSEIIKTWDKKFSPEMRPKKGAHPSASTRGTQPSMKTSSRTSTPKPTTKRVKKATNVTDIATKRVAKKKGTK